MTGPTPIGAQFVQRMHEKRAVGERMNSVSDLQSKKKLVDVTGIEPVTPCLQSIGLDSIPSIRYRQLLTFPINRGTCFRSKANPNRLKTIRSCTLRAQSSSNRNSAE
jgi:hypothetical protein